MSDEPQMTNSAYSLAARICEKDAPPLSLADAPAWCEVLASALLDEAQAFADYRTSVQRAAKTRNPNATCATCPYWAQLSESNYHMGERPEGHCWRLHNTRHMSPPEHWCGEHPDFWATPEEV